MINLTAKLCGCGSERQMRYCEPNAAKSTNCSICKTAGMVDWSKRNVKKAEVAVL